MRGLDTRLATTGWPLTTNETIQLKLAAAIIRRPRILILSQLFDAIPRLHLRDALDRLQADADCTVIYFSGRLRHLDFDTYLYLGSDSQGLYANFEELQRDRDQAVAFDGPGNTTTGEPELSPA